MGYSGGCFSVPILIFQIHLTASLSLHKSRKDQLLGEAVEWTIPKAKLTHLKRDHLPYLCVVFYLQVWQWGLQTAAAAHRSLQPALNFAVCCCHINCPWTLVLNLTPATTAEGRWFLCPNKRGFFCAYSGWSSSYSKMVCGSCTYLHTRSPGEGAGLHGACHSQVLMLPEHSVAYPKTGGQEKRGWAKQRRHLRHSQSHSEFGNTPGLAALTANPAMLGYFVRGRACEIHCPEIFVL